MKEEALKLADAMECRAKIRRNAKDRKSVQENSNDRIADQLEQASQMIRRLVEELEQTKRKYKDMHNLATQAMSRVHQLEKERSQ